MQDRELDALREAIAALQACRSALGDTLIDSALAPLLERLTTLHAAEPLGAPARRLRQVSVLFLDIVGSTQLIQHLDPEDVQSVVDGALAAFTALVKQHGGEVLRYAGDNIKAAFGADGTREDDAERAVNCGLALLHEARQRGAAVQQAHGQAGFDARVGIHTGAVVRGGGVEQDNSLSGLAVNIAARMEQAAPAGGLRISQDTWALVRGVFDAQAQPPIAVKGHDAPIATWLVTAAKSRALRLPARGIAGLETPLVGRQGELQHFDTAVQAVLADRQPRTLTLLAEAGLGKSRLLREFQHSLSAHPSTWWLLPARAQPSGALQPYGLLRDLLLRRLEIADSDSADVARGKFVQGLAPWLSQLNDPAPELLGQLIGLEFSTAPPVVRLGADTRLLYDRALSALRLWLQRLAASDGSSVVLLLDDLHWADDASLDALAKLLKDIQGPVLALLGARPALLERRPDWGDGLPRHERLTLQPLETAHGAALTQSLLHRLGTVPEALSTLIAQQAGGNPFYAEELVMLLIDQGVIERGSSETGRENGNDGDWTFHADRMLPARLPTTLTAVLQARIDALDHETRRALQMASVIGPVFWDDALAALDNRSPAALPALQKKALVQVRPVSTIEHTVEEAFEHHLLHQVSYGTVLKPERREAHARAAAWLTQHVGDRSDEYLAITAQHHERAGQHGLAADCYDRASVKAFARPAYKAALQYLDRAESQAALAHEPWPLERQADALQRRAVLCDALILRDQQGKALDRLLAMGEAHGRPLWVGRALTDKALLVFNLGRQDEAEAVAQRGAEVCESTDDATYAARCRCNLALLRERRGERELARQDLDLAEHWAAKGRERMATPDAAAVEVQVWLIRAQAHAYDDDQVSRRAVLVRALDAVRSLNAPRQDCMCHNAMAQWAITSADIDQANFHLDAAMRTAAEFNLPLQTAIAQLQRSLVHILAGRWDEAVHDGMAAADKFHATGGAVNAHASRGCAAEALWRAGRVDEAVSLWKQVAPGMQQGGDALAARVFRLRLAEARCASGDPDALAEALEAVRAELPAMQGHRTLGNNEFWMAGRTAAWRVLQLAGDPAAATQLALAADEFEHHLSGFGDMAVRERVAQSAPWYRAVFDASAQAAAARSAA